MPIFPQQAVTKHARRFAMALGLLNVLSVQVATPGVSMGCAKVCDATGNSLCVLFLVIPSINR